MLIIQGLEEIINFETVSDFTWGKQVGKECGIRSQLHCADEKPKK